MSRVDGMYDDVDDGKDIIQHWFNHSFANYGHDSRA
jgi:hypothetical protein